MQITEEQYKQAANSIRHLAGATLPVSKANVVAIERAIMETAIIALALPKDYAVFVKTVCVYAADRLAQDIMQIEGPAQ